MPAEYMGIQVRILVGGRDISMALDIYASISPRFHVNYALNVCTVTILIKVLACEDDTTEVEYRARESNCMMPSALLPGTTSALAGSRMSPPSPLTLPAKREVAVVAV